MLYYFNVMAKPISDHFEATGRIEEAHYFQYFSLVMTCLSYMALGLFMTQVFNRVVGLCFSSPEADTLAPPTPRGSSIQ
jgi:hypothetical protein